MQNVLLLCLLALVGMCGIASGHGTGAYSHDSDIGGDKPNWMIDIRDETYLSELSLPGTHDSAALYGGDSAETQSISLTNQLNAGIRVFDIRCRHIDNAFAIHHGIVYQNKNLDDVLTEFKSFVDSHRSEVILARIKLNEHTATGNTRTEDETFEEYFQRYSSHIWSNFDTNGYASVPRLGDVRRKIVILQDFESNNVNKKYGLQYSDGNVFDTQDNYDFSSNWHLYTKWEQIKSKVSDARNEITSKTKFDINYLSGSGGSFPYFVASGHSSHGTSAPRLATGKTTLFEPNAYPDFPRVDCAWIFGCTIAFEGTNILFESHFGGNTDYVGIIMMDFPGKALIDRIISKNNIYYNCNWECYLDNYGDLQNAFGSNLNSARNHYYDYGKNEGRNCQCIDDTNTCNWSCYLQRYSDLRNAFGFDLNSASSHYNSYGMTENRNCYCDGECNWKCYLDRYSDLQNAFGSSNYAAARNHYYDGGKNEARNCLCD